MGLLAKLLRIPHRQEPLTENLKAYQLMRAYERTFLDAQGQLHADAKVVLADLYAQAGVINLSPVRKSDGSISVEDTLINEGKKMMIFGILRRIFKKKILLDDGLSPEEEDQIAATLIEELKEA